jgi:hypothetical protein
LPLPLPLPLLLFPRRQQEASSRPKQITVSS